MKKPPTMHYFYVIAVCVLLMFVSCQKQTNSSGYSGVLETDDLDAHAPVTAQLLALFVDDGSTVSVGDTLAILDTIRAAAALTSASAGANEARARLADLRVGFDSEKINAAQARQREAELTLAQAQRDLKRVEALYAERLVDDKSLELAKLTLAQTLAGESIATQELARLKRGARVDELVAAEAAVERAEAERIVREDQYRKMFLIAHHSGVVQLTPYVVGEIIPAGRVVVTIQNRKNLWAKIYLPEARITQVTIGQRVKFSVDAFSEKSFNATVVQIASETEFTPRNVQSQAERLNLVFAVKLIIDQAEVTSLRPGMPADFFIETRSGEASVGDTTGDGATDE